MRSVIVRYQTKPEHAEENARLVRAVFASLAREKPSALRYATFVEADGVSFVHVATMEDAANNPLNKLDAFAAFQKDIKSRCSEPPVVTEVTIVGSYLP
jgi:quinol monooxygenase YgiN